MMRKGRLGHVQIVQLLEMKWQSMIKSLAIAYHHLPDFGEHASVRDLERRMYNLL